MKGESTDALADILAFIFSPVSITIEHVLEIGVMSFVAGSLVVDGVGEERVETEADEEGLANLVGRGGTSELE